jgi:hypothetical protein
MQAIKKVYLSVFDIFYSSASSEWSESLNSWKGVLGVTLVEWALINIVNIWALFFVRINISGLFGTIGFDFLLVLSFCLNYFALVTRGVGIRYEHELGILEASQRRASTIIGSGVTIIILGILVFSLYAADPLDVRHNP